jgi:hypothetical protein
MSVTIAKELPSKAITVSPTQGDDRPPSLFTEAGNSPLIYVHITYAKINGEKALTFNGPFDLLRSLVTERGTSPRQVRDEDLPIARIMDNDSRSGIECGDFNGVTPKERSSDLWQRRCNVGQQTKKDGYYASYGSKIDYIIFPAGLVALTNGTYPCARNNLRFASYAESASQLC